MAEHDKALDNLDWHIVVLFYATLHKVQAMLRVAGYSERDTDSHVKVKNILNSQFPVVGVDYALLLSHSHVSRYDADYVVTIQDATKAQHLFDSIDKKVKETTAILIKH